MDKRQFLKGMIAFFPASIALQTLAQVGEKAEARAEATAAGSGEYDAAQHWYGMGIEVEKCIGCNRCVEACKAENHVPPEPYFFRTWVERYEIRKDDTSVQCISTQPRRTDETPLTPDAKDVLRTFFVPKLCNHCAHPPCTQVCPVGATFSTEDGVVLVDDKRCIGCRYCIQACPYGARFFNHGTNTADKCTFCYHRVRQGLLPACVEVCPTQARIFGDLKSKASRLIRFQRMNKINVLKPGLNTEPKVYYAALDGEVR
jgi:tetrathionate reductase subunit B